MIGELLAASLGYLLGSISFGNLISRGLPDRELEQFRNDGTGASTVFRFRGARAAGIVMLGDFAKSALVVAICHWLISPQAAMYAGIGALIGNNWPVFYGFRGGRGVAALAGVLVVLVPVPFGLSLIPAILLFWFTRNVTIASLGLFWTTSAMTWVLAYPTSLAIYVLVVPGAVGAYILGARRKVPLTERWRTTFMRSSNASRV